MRGVREAGAGADGSGGGGVRTGGVGPGRPSVPFSLLLLLLVATVAYVGAAGFDQSLRAARGEGAPGMFTAADLTCVQHPGHESCTCNGSFTADGGGEPRGAYLHAAGRDRCLEGARIPAVDAGAANRVYGPDGSREWLFSLSVLAVSLSVAGGLAVRWVRYLLRGAAGTAAG